MIDACVVLEAEVYGYMDKNVEDGSPEFCHQECLLWFGEQGKRSYIQIPLHVIESSPELISFLNEQAIKNTKEEAGEQF